MAGQQEPRAEPKKPQEPCRPGQPKSGVGGMMAFFLDLAGKAFGKDEEETEK